MAVYPLLSIKVSGIINERNFLNTKRQTISIIVQDRSVLMQGINHLNIYANTLKSSCNEDSLAFHEDLVNKFSAIEQSKKSYIAEREALIKSVHTEVPTLTMLFSMNRLYRELGIRPFDIEDKYYPSYRFLYVSSGGNSSLECTVDFDVPTLEKFVHYIASVIEKKNSMVCQRQLMTNNLREQIKRRDGYKCVCCGASLEDEPHLLLEIDRIIPVFKGGKTLPENLQTLCWRCNRSKSDKLVN